MKSVAFPATNLSRLAAGRTKLHASDKATRTEVQGYSAAAF